MLTLEEDRKMMVVKTMVKTHVTNTAAQSKGSTTYQQHKLMNEKVEQVTFTAGSQTQHGYRKDYSAKVKVVAHVVCPFTLTVASTGS